MVTERPDARFRARTGTLLNCRSSGAGTIATETTVVFTLLRRTASSATPTTTDERTFVRAAPTHSGSVIASVTRRKMAGGTAFARAAFRSASKDLEVLQVQELGVAFNRPQSFGMGDYLLHGDFAERPACCPHCRRVVRLKHRPRFIETIDRH